MELDLLRKIGLTDGEIRVYSALLAVRSSPTGRIMKKSKISSSKIYLILDKLIQKGLVSYIIKENIKYFQITNPRTILDYVDREKQELENIKKELGDLVPKIAAHIIEEEEDAQMYKGVKGIRVAYYNILNELKKGEEYCFFAISQEEAEDEKVLAFFTDFHKQRVERGVRVKVISDTTIERLYKKKHVLEKLFTIKHYHLTLPVGVVIGKSRILSIFFGHGEPIAHEIVSSQISKRYQDFFDKIWKIAKN